MNEPAVIDSGADLVASVPADIFAGLDDTPADAGTSGSENTNEEIETPGDIEGDGSGTGGGEGTGDEPASAGDGDAAATAAEEGQRTEPQGAPKQDGQQTEELPEGVTTGKDRNGKPGLFVEESRWKNSIYPNHQLVQKAAEVLGEPLTLEGITLRNNAYAAQERLFNDLNSGDPEAQGRVLDFMLEEMSRAVSQGEVASDPSVPMAQTFYSTLRDKSPDAYASLRFKAATDLLQEMYEEASATGDENLWLSAQHFGKALAGIGKEVTDVGQLRQVAQRMGIPFYAKAEMQGLSRGVDPVSRLQAENARLREQLTGRGATDQAAQFDQWMSTTRQEVKRSVLDDAIKPALQSVADKWKDFPDDYNDLVVSRLQRKVTETLAADDGFNRRIGDLNAQAKRAASAQRRAELTQAIKQAFVNRARLAVEAVKKPVLEFAANGLAERTNQNHARRDGAQNRSLPRGAAGTVPRSLVPTDLPQMKDGIFDPAVAVRQAARLLG